MGMSLGFGPARIASFQSRRKPTPASAVDTPLLAAPQVKPTPAIPYGAAEAHDPYASMTPLVAGAPAMATPSPFQASVNNERAMTANRAATFAAATPLPMTAAPSPDLSEYGRGGTPGTTPAAAPVYSGAYGTGPQAQKQAEAAKAAFVGNQNAVANRNSGNYFQETQLANDANARANSASNAETGYLGAITRGADANTQTVVPAQAGLLQAHAGQIQAEGKRADAMLPYEQKRYQSQTGGIDVQTDATRAGIPFIHPTLQAQLDQQKLERDRYGQMTTPMVAGAQAAAADSDSLFKRMRELNQTESQLNKQKFDQTRQEPVDPMASIKADEARYALAKKLGEDRGKAAYGNQWFKWFGKSEDNNVHEQTEKAYSEMTPVRPAAPPPAPNGATHMLPDGTPIKQLGGRWVNASTGKPVS